MYRKLLYNRIYYYYQCVQAKSYNSGQIKKSAVYIFTIHIIIFKRFICIEKETFFFPVFRFNKMLGLICLGYLRDMLKKKFLWFVGRCKDLFNRSTL